MITVAILINGNPIAARSAVNIEECASGYHKYKLDDGKTLLHRREDGAVKLAIEMLKSIKEVGVTAIKLDNKHEQNTNNRRAGC